MDSFQFMVDPLALGGGTPIFNGIGSKLDLKLTATRAFKSGASAAFFTSLLKNKTFDFTTKNEWKNISY